MLSSATLLTVLVCLAGQVTPLSDDDTDLSSADALLDIPSVNLEERGAGISTLGGKAFNIPFTHHALLVTIGSQDVNLMIDTGSTDLVVFQANCHGCWSQRGVTRAPGTFTATGPPVAQTSVDYGSGSGTGSTYKSSVSVGPKTKKDVEYVSLNRWRGMLLPAPLEGLAGLGLAASSLWQRLVKKKVFALRFVKQRTTIGGLNGEGVLTFGGYDKKTVADPRRINWCPVVGGHDRWTASLNAFHYDGVSEQGNHVALFDSGSNYINGPAQQVRDLYDTLEANGRISNVGPPIVQGGSNVYEFTCANPTQDFTVSFTINNVVYELARNDFQVRVGPITANKCRGAVAGDLTPHPHFDWVLGVPFLRTVYAIFDAEQRKIGLYH